ncbi:hypothetical protein [Pseudalkalibacillus caeni]|uniref:hypothetical protein n=1 Tax=Exobacillus caeni TaxID=2574798 RepID=UPI0014856ECE|nr:hypothetical protein [Pseudalkalibacillus caeni]
MEQKANNSSMARNEEEMKMLGKEMDDLDSNKQVKQKGEFPDPIQSETNRTKESK